MYLDPFDHFVKESVRARHYCRYVDDFVIFHDDKHWLADVRERCRERLASLRLRLHPTKCVISRVRDGTRFLGFRVFPRFRLLDRSNVARMKRRLRRLEMSFARGELDAADLRRHLIGWIAHAEHGDTYQLRTRLFRETTFVRKRA